MKIRRPFLPIVCFALVFLFAINCCNGDDGSEADEGLYLYHGDYTARMIKEYTGDDGQGNFLTSDRPRIVEFYSPYCPACRTFKSTYVGLAEKVQRDFPQVEFYAVSCEAQKDMCKKYNIDVTPTMVAFPGNQAGKTFTIDKGSIWGMANNIKQALQLRKGDIMSSAGFAPSRQLGSVAGDYSNDRGGDDDQANAKYGEDRDGDVDQSSDEESEDRDGDDDNENNLRDPYQDNYGRKDEGGDDDTKYDEVDQDESGDGYGGPDPNRYADTGYREGMVEQKDSNDGDYDGDNTGEKGDGYESPAYIQRAGGIPQSVSRVDPAQQRAPPPPPPPRAYEKGDKDDDDDDDDENSKDSNDNSRGHAPMPPPPPRRSGSAVTAAQRKRDLDRWKEIMQQRLEERRRQSHSATGRLRSIVRKRPVQPVIRERPTEGASARMQGYKPGTVEFEKRRQEILHNLQRIKRGSATAASVPGRIGRLPFRKEVTQKRFAERLPVIKRMVKMSPEEEMILDASLSFLNSLRFGVYTSNGPLPAKKKEALLSWLNLMTVSLPQEWGLHALVDDLTVNIDYLAQSNRNLDSILMKHPLKRVSWSNSCSRGTATSGFTCGLWKLFHIMSVGVAEHRGGLNLIDSGLLRQDSRIFSPIDAADTLREFISQFFTCRECRDNFIESYDDCDNNRRCARLTEEDDAATDADWKELAKWLWEVHNEVNVRLMNARADRMRKQLQMRRYSAAGPGAATRQDEIKALWPSLAQCITCFQNDGSWNEDTVFLFVEKTYWPGADIDPKAKRMLTFNDGTTAQSNVAFLLFFLLLGVLYAIKQSLSPSYVQKTLLMARQIKVGRSSTNAGKRSV